MAIIDAGGFGNFAALLVHRRVLAGTSGSGISRRKADEPQLTGVFPHAKRCLAHVGHIAGAFDVVRRCIGHAMALSTIGLWSATAMAIEEPAYAVTERKEPFEVRNYESYLVAETLVDGAFGSVGNEGFQRLFRYISGDNRASEKITMAAPVEQEAAPAKIAMTAPVEQQRADGRWRIAFVLPASYTLASAPRPTDSRVVLAEVPPRRMAVVRYRGTWSEARYSEELAALRKFMDERGLTAVGEPVFARYDPPFMPWFLRRNEIQIPVQASAAH